MKKRLPPVWTTVRSLFSIKKGDHPPPTSFSFQPLTTGLCLILFLLAGSKGRAQQWQVLANEQALSSVNSGNTNMAIASDGAVSIPYVVYTEVGVAKVKKLQNGAWTQVGGNVANGSASYTRIYTDKTDHLYVTYVDGAGANKLAVKKYNPESGAWEPLENNNSNLYVSTGTVTYNISQYSSTPRSSLAFDSDNAPYIAFTDGSNLTPYVKKFNGTSWVTVGTGPVASTLKAVALSLVLDEADVPWLVFCSLGTITSTTGNMALYSFSSGSWTPVAVSIGGIRHTSMALNAAGNLAIAYFNTGNSNRASVIVYNRTAGTWSSTTALSARDAPSISMISDMSGNLYCSFIDAISTSFYSVARVFKLSAGTTSWRELKDPTVTRGIDEPVGNLHIALGSDTSKPFTVYTKPNSGNVSTPVVRMFVPPAAPVTLSTTPVSSITTNSAVAGGNITSDGGSPVTERGVVYGISSNPTVAHSKVADASVGTGTFSVILNGLTPATAYYVRAYAINAGGISYGNNVRLSSHATPGAVVNTPKQMEYLKRGVVAVRRNTNSVYVGWRLLGTDPSGVAFNVYRDGEKLNESPITTSTNFVDNTPTNSTYIVKPVINGVEGAASSPVSVWATNQLSVPLQIPAGGTTPAGTAYTYSANDCSVGDVDGDGEYEIFVKWDPSQLNHNSGGYSGDQIIDCYKLNGTRLWRINLGKNINAGPHFTQFMVYDLDGDGKAEMACKTADGTVDGRGVVIGDPLIDHRNSSGWVHQGPEYLTVFNGLTGAAMATANYEPARGSISEWGDNYGNRADRFVSAVAYLDGARPSLIIGRGYYNKLARAAYDYRNGQLTLRWKFDSKDAGDPANDAYSGQGNHQMTIGDVDGDGKDEVINGSSAIDDDGTRLWSNRNGHGDALHLTDMDPVRPGLELWMCHESPSAYAPYGLRLNEAKTGETIFGVATSGDVGRALAGDIDPAHKGYEMWGSSGTLYNVKGEQISTNRPSNGSQAVNFGIWWDGDLGREQLDGTILDKWNPATNSLNRVFTIYQAAPVSSNNDTKKNPGLTADLLGDWREEIILRRSDNTALILFTTTAPTEHRIPTLMHDPQYRTAIAWQNSGYNQPPYPSFFLGYDMATPPIPNIQVTDIVAPLVTSINRQEPVEVLTSATTVTYRVHFSENVQGVDVFDFGLTATGNVAGNIASVTQFGAYVDVTIDNITGDGTLRLDVNGNNTGIRDEANNAIDGGFAAGDTYTFDHTSPTLTPVTIASTNAQPAFAKEGDVIRLNFTTSESIAHTEVTIAGQPVQATSLGNNQYIATYVLTSTDNEGVVPFNIQIKDEAGNAGAVSATTDAGIVTYDRTKPLLPSVTLSSNNGNPSFAKEGDVVTINFTASEAIEPPVVTIAGHPIVPNPGASNSYTASYTLTASDAEGTVPFIIDFIDLSGNAGTPITSTTDNRYVTYDRTLPSITAPVDVIVNTDLGNCAATNVNFGVPVIGDNFSVASVTNNATGVFPVGVQTIKWVVTDAAGNSQTAIQMVTVTDKEKPTITVPSPSTFCYSGYGYTVPALAAADNCGISNTSFVITGATVRSGSGTDASGNFGVGTSTITWTVADVHNNQTIGTSIITINAPLSATIADVYAVDQAIDQKNTLYIGYGPTSLTLVVTPNGGTAPYSYRWNTGQTTSTLQVSVAGKYTVTLTDAKGCTTSASLSISVLDVSCGNNQDKVMICHNGSTICVASPAVQEHLNHGDNLGACNATTPTSLAASIPVGSTTIVAPGLTIFPNPSAGQFTVQLNNKKAGKATVLIVDQKGRLIAQRPVTLVGGIQTVSFNISNRAQGIYLVKVVRVDGTKTEKVVLQK